MRRFDIFEVCSKSLKTGRVGLCGAQLRGERVERDRMVVRSRR
jgi:hypothetical protein